MTDAWLGYQPKQTAGLNSLLAQAYQLASGGGNAKTDTYESMLLNAMGQQPGIAGTVTPYNDVQEQAFWDANALGNTPQTEMDARSMAWALPGLMGAHADATDVGNAPAITAAYDAFKKNVLPDIGNQMDLAGLGRSAAVGDSLAKAWSTQVPGLIEAEMARRQEDKTAAGQGYQKLIDTLTGQTQADTSRLTEKINQLWNMGTSERTAQQEGLNRAAGASQQNLSLLSSLLGGQQGLDQQQFQNLMTAGGQEQANQQATFDAEYQEMLRQQGIDQQLLSQPMGGFLPSTIGSTTSNK